MVASGSAAVVLSSADVDGEIVEGVDDQSVLIRFIVIYFFIC